MTDTIEQKALALVNEVSDGFHDVASIYDIHTAKALRSALCRAIEQHDAFRQEVSDAVKGLMDEVNAGRPSGMTLSSQLGRFIIAKPDLLVEALLETFPRANGAEGMASDLRAAIEKRGGKIVWGEG